QDAQPAGLGPRRPQDDDPEALISPWGISYRLRSPFWLPGTPLAWSRAPSPFGSAPPVWR
ncbi:MAG TPA: acyl-CoA transferase, partial [Erwinia persicina]|nr:acyl-CoA transferase [Erwinia persicina]